MPELFEVHTPPDAWRKFSELFQPTVRSERIAVIDALDRVLAENLVAPHDLPSFARSTVDGYAVAAQDTYGASAACQRTSRWPARCRWARLPPLLGRRPLRPGTHRRHDPC